MLKDTCELGWAYAGGGGGLGAVVKCSLIEMCHLRVGRGAAFGGGVPAGGGSAHDRSHGGLVSVFDWQLTLS